MDNEDCRRAGDGHGGCHKHQSWLESAHTAYKIQGSANVAAMGLWVGESHRGYRIVTIAWSFSHTRVHNRRPLS